MLVIFISVVFVFDMLKFVFIRLLIALERHLMLSIIIFTGLALTVGRVFARELIVIVKVIVFIFSISSVCMALFDWHRESSAVIILVFDFSIILVCWRFSKLVVIIIDIVLVALNIDRFASDAIVNLIIDLTRLHRDNLVRVVRVFAVLKLLLDKLSYLADCSRWCSGFAYLSFLRLFCLGLLDLERD